MKIKELQREYEYEQDLFYLEDLKTITVADLKDGYFVAVLLDYASKIDGGLYLNFYPPDTKRLVGKESPIEVTGFYFDQEKNVKVYVRGNWSNRIERKWSRRFTEALRWFPEVTLVWRTDEN